jgi:cathepsin B
MARPGFQSFLSGAILCILVALTERVGAADTQAVFIKYTADSADNCKKLMEAARCLNLCSLVYGIGIQPGAMTGSAIFTLTPSKALMSERCMAQSPMCGVGTGKGINKENSTVITFSQPKVKQGANGAGGRGGTAYNVSAIGDIKKGFQLTFPSSKNFGTCTANYAFLKDGEIKTEKFRDADISWSSVMSREDLLKRTGAKKLTNEQSKVVASKSAIEVAAMSTSTDATPASYNVHEAHPKCKPVIQNQGECGSCWAFSTTGVLAQRFCLAKDDISGLALSPQAQITCNTGCFNVATGKTCAKESATCICQGGCDGGYTGYAFDYMRVVAVTTNLCVPYTSAVGTNPMEGQCKGETTDTVFGLISSCKADEQTDDDVTFKASETYVLEGDKEIMRDIFINGPVQATFIVETPLYGYTGGVFSCDGEEGNDGGHAVIMVGWGEENGVPYWLLQNSWGPEWGDNGYFKIIRDDDVTKSCSITQYVDTALPNTKGVTYNKTTPAPDEPGSGGSSAAPATSRAFVYTAMAAVVALL